MSARTYSEDLEWDSPIIVVGAGRSGSTLVSEIVGAHPKVYNAGETSFLLNRLWDEFFAKPEYVNLYRTTHLLQEKLSLEVPERDCGSFHNLMNEARTGKHIDRLNAINEKEEIRLSRVLGRYVSESLVPPQLNPKYWTFKEIWNGSSSFPYGWRRHEFAFPHARCSPGGSLSGVAVSRDPHSSTDRGPAPFPGSHDPA